MSKPYTKTPHDQLYFRAAYNLVAIVFDGDLAKANEWLLTENPNLGGTTPNHLINAGRGSKLIKFILNSTELNQPPTGGEGNE